MKQWNEDAERWWIDKVATFPGGVVNAVWHMPDAAASRMAWLQKQVEKKNKTNQGHEDEWVRKLDQMDNDQLAGVLAFIIWKLCTR